MARAHGGTRQDASPPQGMGQGSSVPFSREETHRAAACLLPPTRSVSAVLSRVIAPVVPSHPHLTFVSVNPNGWKSEVAGNPGPPQEVPRPFWAPSTHPMALARGLQNVPAPRSLLPGPGGGEAGSSHTTVLFPGLCPTPAGHSEPSLLGSLVLRGLCCPCCPQNRGGPCPWGEDTAAPPLEGREASLLREPGR